MSMIRSIMRSAARKMAKHPAERQTSAFGTVRAGMHQKAEHAYLHTLSEMAVPQQDSEDADPGKTAEEIPTGKIQETSGEETAENIAVITPDAEILEEVGAEDPETEDLVPEAKEKNERKRKVLYTVLETLS